MVGLSKKKAFLITKPSLQLSHFILFSLIINILPRVRLNLKAVLVCIYQKYLEFSNQ